MESLPFHQESDMSTLTFTQAPTPTVTQADRTAGRVTWKRGLATSAVAAVVVSAVAGAFHVAGHALSVTDGAIPLASFAQLVLLFAVVGIVIARHTSRATFYRVTVALTVLSCVPDVALGDGFLSKIGLVLTHVVAAAIIVPRLARR
jgi:small-conductance mechanosensitive channel